MDIFGNQVHPVVQMLFRNIDSIFQDDSSMHTARSVQSWFVDHEDALHLSWPAQLPDLYIFEPL